MELRFHKSRKEENNRLDMTEQPYYTEVLKSIRIDESLISASLVPHQTCLYKSGRLGTSTLNSIHFS